MTQSEMLTAIKNKLVSVVPVAISAASIPPFADFLDEPPTDEGKLQLSVYLAEGDHFIDRESEAFIIQAQLPGIMRPDAYLSALWPLMLSSLDPSLVGMIDRDMTHQTWYPGELPAGGSSSFIYFEARFSRPLDDEDN